MRYAQAKLLLVTHGPRLTKTKTPSITLYDTVSPIHSNPSPGCPSRQRWREPLSPGQRIRVQPPAPKSWGDSQARDRIQSITSNSHRWIHFSFLLSFWAHLCFPLQKFPWRQVLLPYYLCVEMIFAPLAAWWFLDPMSWKGWTGVGAGFFWGGLWWLFNFFLIHLPHARTQIRTEPTTWAQYKQNSKLFAAPTSQQNTDETKKGM